MKRIVSQNANASQLAFDFVELATMTVPELTEIRLTITPLPETQEQWWSNLEYQRIPRKHGIYAIVNTLNGHFYIGSAVSLYLRKCQHFSRLKANKHHNDHLQNSYNLYGDSAFRFIIIEYISDKELLIAREQHYIDDLNPDYNMSPTAGSPLGVKRSEATRKKISETHKGKRGPMSEATKIKIGEANKGRIHTEEVRKNNSEAQKGKTHSEETRQRMSAAQKGKPAHNKGKPCSEATKAKLSESLKGKPLSPATITKRVATRKARSEVDPTYGKKKRH